MGFQINPLTLHVPITGRIELKLKDGTIIKTFGDERKAAGYQEGFYDGMRFLENKLGMRLFESGHPLDLDSLGPITTRRFPG